MVNLMSASVSLVGAMLAYYLGTRIEGVLPTLLAFAGGMFVYLACSDLIPELHHAHKHGEVRNSWGQVAVFGMGIGMIYVLIKVLEG